MKKISLGKNYKNEEFLLDLEAEKVHCILLVGRTGSGKSVFHNHLYKELCEKYLPKEIGFVLLDMTRVDFHGWQSEYLLMPVINNPSDGIQALHDVAEMQTDKIIFVHIEECDMVYADRVAVEAGLDKLKAMPNVYVVYSTSRIDKDYMSDWIERYFDMKVVFALSSPLDSQFLLQSDSAAELQDTHERFVVVHDRSIRCLPFSDDEAKEVMSFTLPR